MMDTLLLEKVNKLIKKRKVSKSTIFRTVHALQLELDAVEMRLKDLYAHTRYWYYFGYNNENDGFIKWCYKLQGKEYNSYDRDRKTIGQKMREVKKIENDFTEVKKRFSNQKEELEKIIRKLKNKYAIKKGNKFKKHLTDSVGKKILDRSCDEVENYRYFTGSGKEVLINFTMFKRDPNKKRWEPIDSIQPKTFGEIGILKLRGYMFDSHFRKKETGNEYVGSWVKDEKRGCLAKAQKAGADQEIINTAEEFKKKMKNTLFVRYLDSNHVSNAKDDKIFVGVLPPRRNKQREKIRDNKEKLLKGDFSIPGLKNRKLHRFFRDKKYIMENYKHLSDEKRYEQLSNCLDSIVKNMGEL